MIKDIRIVVIDSAIITQEIKEILDLLSTKVFIGIKVPSNQIEKEEFKIQSFFLHYDVLILDSIYKDLTNFLKDNDPTFFKLYSKDFVVITDNHNLINFLTQDSANAIFSDKESLLQTIKSIYNERTN